MLLTAVLAFLLIAVVLLPAALPLVQREPSLPAAAGEDAQVLLRDAVHARREQLERSNPWRPDRHETAADPLTLEIA